MRKQKGITLIALIITIVVLLILAAVAINSIQEDGILSYAQNAASQFEQAQENESAYLQEYVNYLNENVDSTTNEENKTYSIGDTVTIGTESFYVIETSDETQETLVLLAKENIDTTNLVQSSDENIIEFSETNYWSDDYIFTSTPYDLIETGIPETNHYAAYAAYQYGLKLGGSGRLMTYNEANTLSSSYGDMIWGKDTTNGYLYYWLCSASEYDRLWYVSGGDSGYFDSYLMYNDECGVRPVVTISKSLIS